MSNILYVYGTLRPGGENVVRIPGKLYDLGWYPGVKLGGPTEILCERIEVKNWEDVDRYEGYNPYDLEGSLYIRRRINEDGYIYEYNQAVNPVKQILSGDWLEYTNELRGRYGGRFADGTGLL